MVKKKYFSNKIISIRTESGFSGTTNCNGDIIVGGYNKAGLGTFIQKTYTAIPYHAHMR